MLPVPGRRGDGRREEEEKKKGGAHIKMKELEPQLETTSGEWAFSERSVPLGVQLEMQVLQHSLKKLWVS